MKKQTEAGKDDFPLRQCDINYLSMHYGRKLSGPAPPTSPDNWESQHQGKALHRCLYYMALTTVDYFILRSAWHTYRLALTQESIELKLMMTLEYSSKEFCC